MKVKAIFVGENGSLGFMKGRVYKLTIEKNTIKSDCGKTCEYGNTQRFLENWQIMKQWTK